MGQVVNLQRIGNPPVELVTPFAERAHAATRPIANRPQVNNLPH